MALWCSSGWIWETLPNSTRNAVLPFQERDSSLLSRGQGSLSSILGTFLERKRPRQDCATSGSDTDFRQTYRASNIAQEKKAIPYHPETSHFFSDIAYQ